MNDMPSCFRTVIRTARKDHVCCECRKQIHKHHLYEYSSGIWSGKPDHFKTCMLCVQVRDLVYKMMPPEFSDEGPHMGGLYEYIRDCDGDVQQMIDLGRDRLTNAPRIS